MCERKEASQGREEKKNELVMPISIVIAATLISFSIFYRAESSTVRSGKITSNKDTSATISNDETLREEAVIPNEGVTLPVRWGELGVGLVGNGVIDEQKLEALYAERGGFTDEMRSFLRDKGSEKVVMNRENSGYLLNLFWALGLGTKNTILEKGPMMDPRYGGAGNFASTGGWTLARDGAMSHYSRHSFFTLTSEQQALVEKVSQNIYRPCCGNSTYFPDCNHGMAMLGLLELMASQGVSEGDMYAAALKVNSYWFPNNYLTIASYMETKGTPWNKVDPKQMLGAEFSSAGGYQAIVSKVRLPSFQGGVGCGE